MPILSMLLLAIALYLALGVAFAIPFVLVGANRIDPVARTARLPFRLLILPGAAALWPLLLARWVRAARVFSPSAEPHP